VLLFRVGGEEEYWPRPTPLAREWRRTFLDRGYALHA
jgi:hypothetical protein